MVWFGVSPEAGKSVNREELKGMKIPWGFFMAFMHFTVPVVPTDHGLFWASPEAGRSVNHEKLKGMKIPWACFRAFLDFVVPLSLETLNGHPTSIFGTTLSTVRRGRSRCDCRSC
jgi:hypothetical protein